MPRAYTYTWSTCLGTFGSHHSKFFLLCYPSRMRFIVTTGNLVPRDFERKTQAIWWQDFPLRRDGRDPPASSTDFGRQLAAYLRALQPAEVTGQSQPAAAAAASSSSSTGPADAPRAGPRAMLAAVLSQLNLFDFAAARVALVTSVPGDSRRGEGPQYGRLRMRELVASEPMPLARAYEGQVSASAPVLCQYSSHSSGFDGRLYETLRGDFTAPPRAAAAPSGGVASGGGSVLGKRAHGELADDASEAAPPAAGSLRAYFTASPARAASHSGSSRGSDAAGSSAVGSSAVGGSAAASSGDGALQQGQLLPVPPGDFKLVWPRAVTIRDSLEGWAGGVSVPSARHHVLSALQLLHKYDARPSGRDASVPHIKTFCRARLVPLPAALRPPDEPGAAASADASAAAGGDASTVQQLLWCYAGSHNMSGAAWGFSQGLPKNAEVAKIISFEMGVMLLPRHYARACALERQQYAEGRLTQPGAVPAAGNGSSSGASGGAQAGDGGAGALPVTSAPARPAPQASSDNSASDAAAVVLLPAYSREVQAAMRAGQLRVPDVATAAQRQALLLSHVTAAAWPPAASPASAATGPIVLVPLPHDLQPTKYPGAAGAERAPEDAVPWTASVPRQGSRDESPTAIMTRLGPDSLGRAFAASWARKDVRGEPEPVPARYAYLTARK
jgi:hypothetical protein